MCSTHLIYTYVPFTNLSKACPTFLLLVWSLYNHQVVKCNVNITLVMCSRSGGHGLSLILRLFIGIQFLYGCTDSGICISIGPIPAYFDIKIGQVRYTSTNYFQLLPPLLTINVYN